MAARKLDGVKLNDELLIKLVRKHPVLYDISHPKYLDNKVKDNIWNTVGQELKAEGSACKLRWNNIRDQYRKRLKAYVGRSGTPEKVKLNKYSEQMAFLTPFFKEKEITGQVPAAGKHTIAAKACPHRVSVSSVDPLDIVQESQSVNHDSDQSQSSSSSESRNPLNNLPSEATATLIEYLLKKHEAEVSPPHPIDTFLAALAPSLKNLNPYHQHLAKGELFAVVHKYELEMLRDQQPHLTDNTDIKQSQ